MSIVKVTLPPGELPVNGKQVSFIAPCDCSQTDALQIDGENYTVVDALCNCVTNVGGRWATGAIVSVILDIDKKYAYVQNSAIDSIVYGSYVGTGVPTSVGSVQIDGRNYPTRLELGFEPRMVWIIRGDIEAIPSMYDSDVYNEDYACFINPIPGIWVYDPIYKNSLKLPVTWDSTGIEFCYPSIIAGTGAGSVEDAVYNASGVTYHYIAIR